MGEIVISVLNEITPAWLRSVWPGANAQMEQIGIWIAPTRPEPHELCLGQIDVPGQNRTQWQLSVNTGHGHTVVVDSVRGRDHLAAILDALDAPLRCLPTVRVTLEGGVVQDVFVPPGVRVVIEDFDEDATDEVRRRPNWDNRRECLATEYLPSLEVIRDDD